MNRRDFLLSTSGLSLVPTLLQAQEATRALGTGLESRLQSLTKSYMVEHHEIPAMYAFIAHGGHVLAALAQGTSDENKTRPADLADQLRIGSNSKAITATLIAVLVDKNLLSWKTRIEDAFPGLAAKYQGNKVLRATIWHLLYHHGGINSHNVFDTSLQGLHGVDWRTRYLELVVSDPGNSGPGDKLIYGPGDTVAVAIAEKLTGKTFERLMSEHLCEPLGITSFCMGRGAKTPTGWVYRESDRSTSPLTLDCNSYLVNDPGGGICLSMADMAKIHSLRAGVRFRNKDNVSTGISPPTRELLNTAPWAAQDGSAMGIWYESDVGVKWLTHAGNTGCGDWSRISILRSGTTMCFYHINYNRPGEDPRPPFEWKDFSSKLRELALQAADQSN